LAQRRGTEELRSTRLEGNAEGCYTARWSAGHASQAGAGELGLVLGAWVWLLWGSTPWFIGDGTRRGEAERG
jgi:hypothetical protein